MKDSFISDDLTDYTGLELDTDAPANPDGMRHSIRPRSKTPATTPRPSHVAATKPAITVQPSRNVIRPKHSNVSDTESDMLPDNLPIDDVTTFKPSMRPNAPLLEVPTRDNLPQEIASEEPMPQAPAILTQWDDLHEVATGARKAAHKGIPVVDLARNHTSHKAFDLLRTQLRQTTQENKWVNIGVTAPTTGCGTTFTAVNLALSLSRILGSRTILMDLNLRDPKVMDAFDMTPPGEMQDYLFGAVKMKDHMMRISDTLALGLNAAADENAAETLQNANTHATLAQMRQSLAPELIIYDLPPMLVSDDVSAFLPQLDGVLLVSDGTQTTASQVLECERMLDGQVPLLGVVLNRARASSIPTYS